MKFACPLLLSLLFLAALAPAKDAPSPASSVTLGNIAINLPASIGDFQRLDSQSSHFETLFGSISSELGQRNIAVYGSENDPARIQQGKLPTSTAIS